MRLVSAPVRPAVLLAAGALVAGALVGPVSVAQSSAPGLPASRALEPTPRDATTPVTFLVGLPRDSAALQEAATVRSTPGDLLYRDHPTLEKAGSAYGATDKTITRLRNAGKRLGLTVSVDKGRILARLTAPVATWEKLYGATIAVERASAAFPYRTYSFASGEDYAGAPAALKPYVSEMLAVYVEYVAKADQPGTSESQLLELQETLAAVGTPRKWPRSLGTLPKGTCDTPALAQGAAYAPGQLQTAYGTAALAAGKGVRGVGARMTIVSLGGGYAASDIEAAARCFGHAEPRIDVVRGTGVAKPIVSASTETHLDLVTASAVLARAESLTLLQVVDSEIGFTDAFARMLNGTVVPDAVSVSYGVCEPVFVEGFAPLLTLNEDLLRMAAIVGTSVVVATGDNGTSMCGAEIAAATGEPTLWYPSTSPWVTAAGGTRLTLKPDNSRASERVWNDIPYVGSMVPAPAGAGGPSSHFTRPWWQTGATPRGPRAVPDVALLGAIKPGWPIAYGGGIYAVGGTSGAAPFLAANLAAMSAKQRDRGYPTIGFANAWMYAAAAAEAPPFYDVTLGINSVQLVGCCAAYPGYDMASGLGAPQMDALYASLPRPAG